MRSLVSRLAAISAFVALCLDAVAAQSLLRTHPGATRFENYGIEVAGLGDLDGDGVRDYAVGSQGRASDSIFARIQIFSGATGGLIRETSESATSGFGTAICGADDLDGDGVEDYLVGRPFVGSGPTSGQVRAFSGADGSLIRTFVDNLSAQFGQSIERLGDFDSDGCDDFVATAPGAQVAVMVSARTGSILARVTAPPSIGTNPNVLATVGDVDGDGWTDFATSEPGFNQQRGRVFVHSGLTGLTMRTFTFTAERDVRFGQAVTGIAGRAPGGRAAIAIAAPLQLNPLGGSGRGVIYVFDVMTGILLDQVESPLNNNPVFAEVLESMPDLNSDGVDELVASAPFGLGATAIDGRRLSTMFEWQTNRGVRAIRSIGDLDFDGVGELLLGSPDEGAPGVIGGSAHVISTRIFATTTPVGGGCSGGPFPIEIGMTRPLIGTFATLACRDAPLGVSGVIALGPWSETPFSFGTPECSIPIDLGASVVAPAPSGTNWQILIDIPSIPQLIGQEVGIQCLYAPTLGPFGFDLSNALRLRFGDR